jgi:hypothetical protein
MVCRSPHDVCKALDAPLDVIVLRHRLWKWPGWLTLITVTGAKFLRRMLGCQAL